MKFLKDCTAEELLNMLADDMQKGEELRAAHNLARKKAIPDEVAKVLLEIDTQHGEEIAAAEGDIPLIRDRIKELVVDEGETIKGDVFMAVYSKSKGTWNYDFLHGVASMKPEILQGFTPGEPTVSIRKR